MSSAEPLLDTAALERMQGLRGDSGRDLAVELAELFEQQVPGSLEQLQEAARAADLRLAERAAHTLKGFALTVGAQRLASLCRLAEDHARAGRGDDVAAMVPALQQTFRATLPLLRGRG